MFDYLNNPAAVPPSFGGGPGPMQLPGFQGAPNLGMGAASTAFNGSQLGSSMLPSMLGQPMTASYPMRLGAALLGGNGNSGFLQALQQGSSSPGNNAPPPVVNWLSSLPAPAPAAAPPAPTTLTPTQRPGWDPNQTAGWNRDNLRGGRG